MSRNVVLVCGSHRFGDETHVWNVLSEMHEKEPFTALVHGGAEYIDTFAGAWAEFYCVPQIIYPANWDMHGLAAGPIRNTRMLVCEQPDRVVAFKGENGTKDMVTKAKKAKVPVYEIP